eukprot:gene24013-biopygen13419
MQGLVGAATGDLCVGGTADAQCPTTDAPRAPADATQRDARASQSKSDHITHLPVIGAGGHWGRPSPRDHLQRDVCDLRITNDMEHREARSEADAEPNCKVWLRWKDRSAILPNTTCQFPIFAPQRTPPGVSCAQPYHRAPLCARRVRFASRRELARSVPNKRATVEFVKKTDPPTDAPKPDLLHAPVRKMQVRVHLFMRHFGDLCKRGAMCNVCQPVRSGRACRPCRPPGIFAPQRTPPGVSCGTALQHFLGEGGAGSDGRTDERAGGRAEAVEHREVAVEHREVAVEHREVAEEHREVAVEHREAAVEH